MSTSPQASTLRVRDHSRSRRIAALALCVGASCASSAPAAAAVSTAPNVSYVQVGDPSGYLSRLNSERAAHGLAPLAMRADLTYVAMSWATHMANTGLLQHNPRLASAVTNWLAVGENVGDGPSIHDLDVAFMNSPKHRDNILDPSYEDVGIGTVTRAGMIWIAVVFRDVERPDSTMRTRTTTHPTDAPVVVRTVHARPMLSIGSSGTAVRRVQRRVQVIADGLFGPKTRSAVLSFQRRHGVVVDGIVGPRTWAALNRRTIVVKVAKATHCSGLSTRCSG